MALYTRHLAGEFGPCDSSCGIGKALFGPTDHARVDSTQLADCRKSVGSAAAIPVNSKCCAHGDTGSLSWIADELMIGETTVRTHVKRIMIKRSA